MTKRTATPIPSEQSALMSLKLKFNHLVNRNSLSSSSWKLLGEGNIDLFMESLSLHVKKWQR